MPEITCGGFTASGEKLPDKAGAEKIRMESDGQAASVLSVEKQVKTVQPPRLYDLTTLQRECNRIYGYTAQQTLDYVQSLYEKKLATYPRTDSQYLTEDMQATAASLVLWLRGNMPFGKGCAGEPDIGRVTDGSKEYIQKIIGKKISPETKVLVSIGELSKRKNHQLLIDMMADLKDMDIICIIGGTGEEKILLHNKIKELHLEEKVFLAGYIEDVPAMLHASDCFVLPSFREGLPVVVMEAMSAGLPIIAGRIRGVTDLVKDMEGGYLVKSFEPVDFAVKARKLFTDREEKSYVIRKRMGKWNQERVKKFSKNIVEKRMEDIYKSIDGYINSNKL